MGIFYKLTAPNGAESFLFGTVHLGSPEIVTLPREVMRESERANYFVFEADILEAPDLQTVFLQACEGSMASVQAASTEQLTKWWQENAYQKNTPKYTAFLKKASKELAKKLEEGFKKQHNAEVSALMTSEVVSQIAQQSAERLLPLQLAPAEMHLDIKESFSPLDQLLMKKAKEEKKPLYFIETLAEQLPLTEGLHFSLLEQIEMYNLICDGTVQAVSLKEIIKLYLAGQPCEGIKSKHGPLPALFQRYLDAISKNRDNLMTQFLEERLQTSGGFVGIGYGHLPGVIAGLQAKGFTVKEIPCKARVCSIQEPLQRGDKVAAFRIIYSALYAGQSSLFKSRGFFKDNTAIFDARKIEAYVEKNPNSRTAFAWKLAQQHFEQVSSKKTALIQAIHHYAHQKSSTFGLFKQTKNFVNGYDHAEEKIAKAAANSRTGLIRDALNTGLGM